MRTQSGTDGLSATQVAVMPTAPGVPKNRSGFLRRARAARPGGFNGHLSHTSDAALGGVKNAPGICGGAREANDRGFCWRFSP
jgi:hypothetical protein